MQYSLNSPTASFECSTVLTHRQRPLNAVVLTHRQRPLNAVQVVEPHTVAPAAAPAHSATSALVSVRNC